MTQKPEDVRRRVIAQALFLRAAGQKIVPQRIWNGAADIVEIATEASTGLLDNAIVWLKNQRGRL